MLVRKMHYSWKIVCVYYKEKSLQSKTESLWLVCNLQTVLLDGSGFLHKEKHACRSSRSGVYNELCELDSVLRQISKAAPSINWGCAAATASGPCLAYGHLVLTA